MQVLLTRKTCINLNQQNGINLKRKNVIKLNLFEILNTTDGNRITKADFHGAYIDHEVALAKFTYRHEWSH